MFNRFIRATLDFASARAHQTAGLLVFTRDTFNGFITTAHHTVMILGITAIAALTLMFVKPEFIDHLKALSPFQPTQEQAQTPGLSNVMGTGSFDERDQEFKLGTTANNTAPQQKRVTSWLSKRYRVAGDATDMLVSAAYDTAKNIRLDPLLILAVMAIESGFNPFAESPVGAQGLMQVMSKIHSEKFVEVGGMKAALNPIANIRVGSLILKEYVTRGGSIEAGLKMYVGAAAFEDDSGYGYKVLAEYRRLKDVAGGKNVPLMTSVAETKQPPKDRLQSSISMTAESDSRLAAL
jgi:hypothetical protein